MAAHPIVNRLNRPFWDGADAGTLRLPVCRETGRAFWPPSPISPFGDGGVEWRDVDPAGTVRALAVYRRPFLPAFAALLPYGIALIELDAGPRLQVHVPDPDAADAPRTGDRVTIGFRAVLPGGRSIPILSRPNDGDRQ